MFWFFFQLDVAEELLVHHLHRLEGAATPGRRPHLVVATNFFL